MYAFAFFTFYGYITNSQCDQLLRPLVDSRTERIDKSLSHFDEERCFPAKAVKDMITWPAREKKTDRMEPFHTDLICITKIFKP